MGIITLALIATGHWTDLEGIPFWAWRVACAVAIAAGTYIGAGASSAPWARAWWRSPHRRVWLPSQLQLRSFLASSHLGFALSTTHVATGSILGSGIGRRGAEVRWGVAGRMVLAWLTTLPMAGLVGAVMWAIGNLLGATLLGPIVSSAFSSPPMCTCTGTCAAPVDHTNVNESGSARKLRPPRRPPLPPTRRPSNHH